MVEPNCFCTPLTAFNIKSRAKMKVTYFLFCDILAEDHIRILVKIGAFLVL